ncbi:hypothetical protein M514_09140, partial [Trichuris suis]
LHSTHKVFPHFRNVAIVALWGSLRSRLRCSLDWFNVGTPLWGARLQWNEAGPFGRRFVGRIEQGAQRFLRLFRLLESAHRSRRCTHIRAYKTLQQGHKGTLHIAKCILGAKNVQPSLVVAKGLVETAPKVLPEHFKQFLHVGRLGDRLMGNQKDQVEFVVQSHVVARLCEPAFHASMATGLMFSKSLLFPRAKLTSFCPRSPFSSFLDTVGGIGHTTIQRLKRSARRICPCINARDPMELRQTCLLSIALVGFVLLIAGAVILAILPSFVHNGVLEAISLSNGSKAEKAWENPPYEMSMQVWFFNITNADEVMLYQAKPSLVELGPYGYDEHQRKVAVTYYDNGTMGYQNLKWFEFNASKSCRRCRPLDLVTVPNVPFWTLLHKLRRSGSLPKFKKFISFGLLGVGEGAFITRSIDALLFTGYHDIIFAMAKMFHWLSPDTQVPDRMGFMYGKNFTLDGAYLIKSGQTNYLERGRLELYKGKSSVNVWADVWSNMINGSDGTLNPPFLERTSRLPLFSPDLCRSLYVDYSEDVHSGGFDAYRFTVPPEVFDDRRAENAGFCWPTDVYYPENQKVDYTTGLACLPSGLLNISKCQMDAPIVLSSPHFLHASKEVQNSVFGLRPNVKEHTTWMDIEPVSGLGIEFQRKLQINVAMVQDSDFSTVKRMRSVIMPVLWLNESAFLNAEAKLDLWHRLFLPQIIAKAVGAILIITGALGSLLAIGFFTHYRQKSKNEPGTDLMFYRFS